MSDYCVHDANTTGLTGPADGTPTGSLYAVTKGQGISSSKRHVRGSFGHNCISITALSVELGVFTTILKLMM